MEMNRSAVTMALDIHDSAAVAIWTCTTTAFSQVWFGHSEIVFFEKFHSNVFFFFGLEYREVADIEECDIHLEPLPSTAAAAACNYECPTVYKPVCAAQGNQYQLFSNDCRLRLHNCKYHDRMCYNIMPSWTLLFVHNLICSSFHLM